MSLSGVDGSAKLSRRERAELWVSGSRSAQEIPEGESKAQRLATLFRFAGSPSGGGEALKLLHEILVDQVDMLLQVREQEDARVAAARVLNQYVDMYDFAPIPFLSIDSQCRVSTANWAAGELLEMSVGQVVGEPLRSLFDEKEGCALQSWITSLRFGPDAQRHVKDFERDTHHPRRLHAVASRIEASDTTLLMLVDVTHSTDATTRSPDTT